MPTFLTFETFLRNLVPRFPIFFGLCLSFARKLSLVLSVGRPAQAGGQPLCPVGGEDHQGGWLDGSQAPQSHVSNMTRQTQNKLWSLRNTVYGYSLLCV